MSKNFIQNRTLRWLGLTALRSRARVDCFRSGPRVFINSLPKSGTHLVTAILELRNELNHSYLHIPTSAVNKSIQDQNFELNSSRMTGYLRSVRKGQFFSSHLPYDQKVIRLLDDSDINIINIIRDPRDILISRLHYVKGLKRHRLHDYIYNQCADDKERMERFIFGPKDGEQVAGLVPYIITLQRFKGWMNDPSVLTLKYEDLVGERGGGTRSAQINAYQKLFDHIGLPLDKSGFDELSKATGQTRTPTLRKGVIGGWKNQLDSDLQELLQEQLSDYLSYMQYE